MELPEKLLHASGSPCKLRSAKAALLQLGPEEEKYILEKYFCSWLEKEKYILENILLQLGPEEKKYIFEKYFCSWGFRRKGESMYQPLAIP